MANLHVSRSLKKFGSDIRSARLRRRLPMALVGNVAAVIYALGMGTPFSELLDQKNDAFGLMLDEERLPKRARLPKVES